MKFFDFSEHKGDVIGPWKKRNHSSPGYHTTDGLSHQLKWLLQARRKNPRPRSRASTKSGNPILTPHPAGVDAPDRAAMLGSIGWWHSCNSGGRQGNRHSPATMYAGRSRSAALQRLSGWRAEEANPTHLPHPVDDPILAAKGSSARLVRACWHVRQRLRRFLDGCSASP